MPVVPPRSRLIRVPVIQRDYYPWYRVLEDCLPENPHTWGNDWLSAGFRQIHRYERVIFFRPEFADRDFKDFSIVFNLAWRVGDARFPCGNSHRAHIARALEVGVWPLPVRDMVRMIVTFYMMLAGGVVTDVRVPVWIGPGRNDIHITCQGTVDAAKQKKLVTVTDGHRVHRSVIDHVFVSTIAIASDLMCTVYPI
jgi:hypothetical protein